MAGSKKFTTVYKDLEVQAQGFVLKVQPVQEGVGFKVNEPIEFEISLFKDGVPYSDYEVGELYAYFKWSSEKIIWRSDIELVAGKARIMFKSDFFGFGNLHVHFYKGAEEVLEQIRGLAVSPELLHRSYPCPKDFDSFWSDKIKKCSLTNDIVYTKIDKNSHPHLHNYSHKALIESDSNHVDLHDVNFATEFGFVSGILTRPKKRAAKGLAAVLYLHGAGVRPCEPGRFLENVGENKMIFEINAHGIPNDKEAQWYVDLGREGALKEYHRIGRDNLENNYYVKMFMRVKAALDFLKQLPEWDGKVLLTMGGSQGAMQSYAGAYLDDAVSAIVASIPAYGDLTGFLKGRQVIWPDWLRLDPRGRVDQNVFKVAPYIDSVNLLRNYKKDACVCFGLLDQGCTPTTNFVPINECPGDIEIIIESDCYHRVCPEAEDLQWAFIETHIRKMHN